MFGQHRAARFSSNWANFFGTQSLPQFLLSAGGKMLGVEDAFITNRSPRSFRRRYLCRRSVRTASPVGSYLASGAATPVDSPASAGASATGLDLPPSRRMRTRQATSKLPIKGRFKYQFSSFRSGVHRGAPNKTNIFTQGNLSF